MLGIVAAQSCAGCRSSARWVCEQATSGADELLSWTTHWIPYLRTAGSSQHRKRRQPGPEPELASAPTPTPSPLPSSTNSPSCGYWTCSVDNYLCGCPGTKGDYLKCLLSTKPILPRHYLRNITTGLSHVPSLFLLSRVPCWFHCHCRATRKQTGIIILLFWDPTRLTPVSGEHQYGTTE